MVAQCLMQDSDASDSESDRSGSVADSAFIYKAQAAQKFGGSLGGPEFDRMSQRLEKDLGLGNDMESLMSMERGGSQVCIPSLFFAVSVQILFIILAVTVSTDCVICCNCGLCKLWMESPKQSKSDIFTIGLNLLDLYCFDHTVVRPHLRRSDRLCALRLLFGKCRLGLAAWCLREPRICSTQQQHSMAPT